MQKNIEREDDYDYFDDDDEIVELSAEDKRREALLKLNEKDKKQELKQKSNPEVNQEVRQDVKQEVQKKEEEKVIEPVNIEVTQEVTQDKMKRTLKTIDLIQSDDEMLQIFNNLPVSPEKYERYIKKYRLIIKILNDITEGYAFVEQVKEVYIRLYGEITDRSFQLIIEAGEKDCFWGSFKPMKKYKAIYLKANSYLCYLRMDRTAVDVARITTKMLVKSTLLLNIKSSNVEKIDIPTFQNLYKVKTDGKKQILYFIIVTASHYSNPKRINKLITELHKYSIDTNEGAFIRVISQIQLDTETEKNFLNGCIGTSFGMCSTNGEFSSNIKDNVKLKIKSSFIVADIGKYFNGLMISLH